MPRRAPLHVKSSSSSSAFSQPADALRAWLGRERPRFDTLAPAPDLWAAIEQQLAAEPATAPADALRGWAQHHRAAFDTLEPRADQWAAIERQLAPVASPPLMTASRGGAGAADASRTRPAWWQLAAAVVVFGLGYGARLGTEPGAPTAATVAISDLPTDAAPAMAEGADDAATTTLHVAAPRHGFRNHEPDPAMQAAVLASHVAPTADDEAGHTAAARPAVSARAAAGRAELAPEIARLEARYDALVARHRAATHHRFVSTPALADEFDREMAVLDSAYAALRQALPRSRRPDDVVAAMNRNLHLRLDLLHRQVQALDAVQEARQRATGQRMMPRRPPAVNPDNNGVNIEDLSPASSPASSGGTLVPPAPPAPEPLPGLGARVAPRRRLAV